MKQKTVHPAIAMHNAIHELGLKVSLNEITYRMYLQLRLIKTASEMKWQT